MNFDKAYFESVRRMAENGRKQLDAETALFDAMVNGVIEGVPPEQRQVVENVKAMMSKARKQAQDGNHEGAEKTLSSIREESRKHKNTAK